MTGFPSGLECERVQDVQSAVVAADGEELRRGGPRDTRDAEARGRGVRFEVAQDTAIRSHHNDAAAWCYKSEGAGAYLTQQQFDEENDSRGQPAL